MRGLQGRVLRLEALGRPGARGGPEVPAGVRFAGCVCCSAASAAGEGNAASPRIGHSTNTWERKKTPANKQRAKEVSEKLQAYQDRQQIV
ncbi:unnamed protein product [Coccothraustes coccothraustes]